MDFIEIESAPDIISGKVKQHLRFKTGKFVWRIRFSAQLDPATITQENVFVTNLDGDKLETAVRYNVEKQEIELEPLQPYTRDTSYLLNISQRVASIGGQMLKENVQLKFKV